MLRLVCVCEKVCVKRFFSATATMPSAVRGCAGDGQSVYFTEVAEGELRLLFCTATVLLYR